MIRSHITSSPDIPLDKPEQFLYDLSEISNFAERISCFMFEVEFADSILTIEHTLTNIKSTCEVSPFSICTNRAKSTLLVFNNKFTFERRYGDHFNPG